MAKKPQNEHAKTTPGETETAHEHAGSSVGFYIFIALVLGVITYVEFAMIEYQDTWFSFMGGTLILIWLIVLSIVKFILVVMFFMHLKDDDRTFTGFFTSGMVIAVGTLIALSALFTVRSLATAQTPQQEQGGTTAGAGTATGSVDDAHGEVHGGEVPEPSLAHRFKYPAPKTLGDVVPDPSAERQGDDARGAAQEGDAGANGEAAAAASQGETGASPSTSQRLPQAPPPPAVTLPDPFAQQAQGAQDGAAPSSDAAAGEVASAAGDSAQAADAAAGGDAAAGEALFVGALGCVGCHGEGGAGGVGPSLNDDEWIYGGDQASLTETLLNGRPGGMPAFGAQASEEDIANVVAYVMSLSGAQSE